MHLELLTSSFEHVVGTDIAKRALLRAENKYAACGLLMVDAPRLPLAEGTFDLVIDRGCFSPHAGVL